MSDDQEPIEAPIEIEPVSDEALSAETPRKGKKGRKKKAPTSANEPVEESVTEAPTEEPSEEVALDDLLPESTIDPAESADPEDPTDPAESDEPAESVLELAHSLPQVVEAILFASQKPMSVKELISVFKGAADTVKEIPDAPARAFAKLKEPALREAIEVLETACAAPDRAYEVRESAAGWQLVTKPQFSPWLRQLFPEHRSARLSAPAMETLAIIAYRQPITRADIEAVRGVAVDGVMQTLLDRGLVKIAGRADLPGRPLLYDTTQNFMEHFGLKNLDDLPNAAELRKVSLPTAEPPEPDTPPATPEGAPPAPSTPEDPGSSAPVEVADEAPGEVIKETTTLPDEPAATVEESTTEPGGNANSPESQANSSEQAVALDTFSGETPEGAELEKEDSNPENSHE